MALISRSLGFIFIKTRKTAGTSLEVYLSQYMSDDDVVTPILPANHHHRPRNFEVDGKPLFYNHMRAAEMKSILRSDYDDQFSFCVERHPIEKCLSYFAMMRNAPFFQHNDNPKSWDEYVERADFPVDTLLYTNEDGALLVDKIFRYEELDQSLMYLSAEIGIQFPPLTVKEKTGFRSEHIPRFEDVLKDGRQASRIMDSFSSSLAFTPYDLTPPVPAIKRS